jgi:hypothetical protein
LVVAVTWEQRVLVWVVLLVDWVLASVEIGEQQVWVWMLVAEVVILAELEMMAQIPWLHRYPDFLHYLWCRIVLLYFYEIVVIEKKIQYLVLIYIYIYIYSFEVTTVPV